MRCCCCEWKEKLVYIGLDSRLLLLSLGWVWVESITISPVFLVVYLAQVGVVMYDDYVYYIGRGWNGLPNQ